MAALARRVRSQRSEEETDHASRIPINVDEYAAMALRAMDATIWDMYMGGSDDERTLEANRAALSALRLRPRYMVDVGQIDLTTTVVGTPLPMPILIAPTSLHRLAHPEGESATARGAGAVPTIYTVSTLASQSIEEIAAAATGPLWFQLYCFKDRGLTTSLIQRAEHAGYRAIVLTIDAQRIGNRERDVRNGFHLPPGVDFANLTDPSRQQVTWATRGEREMLTWDVIDWIRAQTKLPLLLKGIMTEEDAAIAAAYGVDGIIVSNHGGRQLDTTLATIEALPEIVEAVAGRCEVLMDGGIRRGTDIMKALALGASAVLIGRPVLWGLAARGAAGVQHVLEILRDELELSMALAGRTRLNELTATLVRR